jgi:hypothetical protein
MGAVSPALAGGPVDTSGLASPSIIQLCQNIGAGLLSDQFRIQAHKQILCELMCCCNTRPAGAASPGISDAGEGAGGATRQTCVHRAMDGYRRGSDLLGRDPMHFSELSYNMQFPNPVPMMDYATGGGFAESLARGQTPQVDFYGLDPLDYQIHRGRIAGRAGREFAPGMQRPGGAGGYRVRRPDVVVSRDPSRLPYNYPPTGYDPSISLQENLQRGIRMSPGDNNILGVFEMKFPGETEHGNQFADYQRIAGPGHFEVLNTGPTSCGCQDGERQPYGQPATVPYSRPAGIQDLVPSPATSPQGQPAPTQEPGGGSGPADDDDPPIVIVPPPNTNDRKTCISLGRGRRVCF